MSATGICGSRFFSGFPPIPPPCHKLPRSPLSSFSDLLLLGFARFDLTMVVFGKSAAGRNASKTNRPPMIDFAFEVTAARNLAEPLESSIPLPHGWSFNRSYTHLLLEPSALSFSEFRASFVFVAPIGRLNPLTRIRLPFSRWSRLFSPDTALAS